MLWIILSLSGGVGAALLIGICTLKRTTNTRKIQHSMATELLHLQSEVAALCRAGVQVSHKIAYVNQTVDKLSERQEKVEQTAPQQAAYKHANKMVEMGADVEDLVTSCGLSRAEAALVAKMSQKAQQQKVEKFGKKALENSEDNSNITSFHLQA